jgi:hypothetical protein
MVVVVQVAHFPHHQEQLTYTLVELVAVVLVVLVPQTELLEQIILAVAVAVLVELVQEVLLAVGVVLV